MKACPKKRKVSEKTERDAKEKGKVIEPVLTKISRETTKLRR